MALLDSKFIVEVVVEDFKSYVPNKDLAINCQFADVFKVSLKNPNELRKISKGKKNSRNVRERKGKSVSVKSQNAKAKPHSEQQITFTNNTHSLIYAMRNYNIELFICSKDTPDVKIGSVSIPWNEECIDYITSLVIRCRRSPASINGEYSLNDYAAKCVAKIKLNIKLSCVKFNNIVEHIKSYAEKFNHPSEDEVNQQKNESPTKGLAFDDYIDGDKISSFANQVYCVNYFTVQSDPNSSALSHTSPSKSSDKVIFSLGNRTSSKLRICKSECLSRNSMNEFKLDTPIGYEIRGTKCKNVHCTEREHIQVQNKKDDDKILIDISGQSKTCGLTHKIEEMMGTMHANMTVSEENPCYCTCECTFGLVKKTTYCGTCGGYETAGEDHSPTLFPCPVFHKLIDKSKLKTLSTSGSDINKKKGADSQRAIRSATKSPEGKKKAGDEGPGGFESELESKKGKKKRKDDRFKFNYGYEGIPPHIGHSQCGIGCGACSGNVPKNMGWLWTAGDIPGLKFRPNWKPGATNKHVVRLLKIARNPGEAISKKRRKDTGKKKRPLKRPLLIVHKKDGEYNVTMETMKQYSKPRALNQHPYEDKPVVTYTIGRTDEENRDRKKKKERKQRRLEREQRDFIQSAFKNMCQEICLKTYQQALGLLPDAEDPECACYPAQPDPNRVNMDISCSCSEDNSSLGSDTDSDEWIVEFTPPNAKFDPTYKGKKVLTVDNSTQYTYLDYRVKLLDFSGNQVPRFFKGPDGKQQCSDLGVFKDSTGKWLEINVDGFIAPDGKWVPNMFFGPNGEQVEALGGKFQAMNGNWLVLGVDGYVDCNNKFKYYSRPKPALQKKDKNVKRAGAGGDKKDVKLINKPSEATWSCFGYASPKDLSRMGIMGHGNDRKRLIESLKALMAHGDLDIKIPQLPTVPPSKGKRKRPNKQIEAEYLERATCKHPVPSDKGVMATDRHGNKKYFRLKGATNERPKARIADLHHQGKSVSSFHMLCYDSFIDAATMKQQQYERLLALSGKDHACAATQIG